MEQQFLTIWYLKYYNNFEIEMCDNLIPIGYKTDIDLFYKKIGRLPNEFELIKFLIKIKLYKEAISFLAPDDFIENTIFQKEIATTTLNYGELINYYIDNRRIFNNNTDDISNEKEYKKITIIENILKQIEKDEIGFLFQQDIVNLINYFSESEQIYSTKLPVFNYNNHTYLLKEQISPTTNDLIEDLKEQNNSGKIIFIYNIRPFINNLGEKNICIRYSAI